MPLADLQVRNAKAGEKVVRLSDDVQLCVTPDGLKYWRLAYRFSAMQKVLAVGFYPKAGL